MILMAKQFMKRRCIIVLYIFLYLVNNTMGQDYKQVYIPLRPFSKSIWVLPIFIFKIMK